MRIYIVEWDSGSLYDGERTIGNVFERVEDAIQYLENVGLVLAQTHDVIYPEPKGLYGIYLQEDRKQIYGDVQYGRFARIIVRTLK